VETTKTGKSSVTRPMVTIMPSSITRCLVWLVGDMRRIALVYACSLLVGGTAFWLAEDIAWGDGMYWSFVTSLTIGYGDYSPHTAGGKIITFVFAHIWVYLIGSLFIAAIVTRVMPDPHQYSHAEQEWTFDALKAIADKLDITLPDAPTDTESGNNR